jgi:putative transposase
VWQNRFLEHTIRDEDDFSNHMDYVHFNPVKHGYCDVPTAWRWSSLHAYVERGVYPVHWCMTEQDHKSIQSKLEHICFE